MRIQMEWAHTFKFLSNLHKMSGIIPHHRALVLTLQFAFKLNLAINLLQETLLDSVPYAEDAN